MPLPTNIVIVPEQNTPNNSINLDFNNGIYTLIGEIYNNHPDIRSGWSTPLNYIEQGEVNGTFVKMENNEYVFVMQGQGYPFELKESLVANEYKQLKTYENFEFLTWEAGLQRDYLNDKYTNTLINKYGQDYLNIALQGN